MIKAVPGTRDLLTPDTNLYTLGAATAHLFPEYNFRGNPHGVFDH
jgi:hypothetical protein